MTAKLISITGKVMLSLLLAVIVGALVVLTVVPRAVGGAALTVLTGSMTPEIAVGSVVVVRPVDPGTLRIGDVITYQTAPGKSAYVTHRITDVHSDTDPVTLTTKGDANRGADLEPVPVTAVRGKVLFSVPYLGTIKNLISTGSAGLLFLVLGLLSYAGFQVLAVLRERRTTLPAPTTLVSTDLPPNTLQLQLLAVTLAVAEFEGLSPVLVARFLRMDLVDEGTATFTLAIAREPEQLDELEELLRPFAPISTQRSTLLGVTACATREVLADRETHDVAA